MLNINQLAICNIETESTNYLMSENLNQNLGNILILKNIIKQLKEVLEEAETYNAPAELGDIITDDYTITLKQGSTTQALSTEKTVKAIAKIDPLLVPVFASGLAITKAYFKEFCVAYNLKIKDADVLSDTVTTGNPSIKIKLNS